jgi:hypothetical protein
VLAPLGDRLDPSGAARPFVNYFTHAGGSIFPLLPWAGYVFVGVVAAELVLPHGSRTAPALPVRRLAILTAASFAIALFAELVPFSWIAESTHRNAEPAFTILKLAATLLVVLLLAAVGRRIPRLPNVLSVLAGESLILYLAHLFVLYGLVVGINRHVGHTLPFPTAMLVATAMVPFIGLVGLGWHRLKAWSARAEGSRIRSNAGAAGP